MVIFLRSIKSFRYIPENESKQVVLGWKISMINSTIERGRVAGILRSIYTSSIFTTMIKSTIVRVILDGIKRPIFTSYITCRHFKTFIIRSTIVIIMVGGIMAVLSGIIPKTSITTNIEITCLAFVD